MTARIVHLSPARHEWFAVYYDIVTGAPSPEPIEQWGLDAEGRTVALIVDELGLSPAELAQNFVRYANRQELADDDLATACRQEWERSREP